MPTRAPLSLAIATTLGLGLLVGPAVMPSASATPAAQIVDSPTSAVYDAAVGADGTTYAVGSFTAAGAATGGLARLDAGDGTVDRAFPMVNGYVFAMATDDQGAIYLGGDFVAVGGQPRTGLAKLNPDGSVAEWAPQVAGGYVNTMLLDGDVVYVGGSFTSIDGLTRTSLAGIDAEQGDVTGWSPVLTRSPAYIYVDALAMDDTHVYVGGSFDTFDGEDLLNLARFTRSTGLVDAGWEPDANYGVRSVEAGGSVIYVGGYFSQIGGQSRTNLAALDAVTGAAANWYPHVAASVESMLLDDTVLYIGGGFFQVEGQTRRGVAAVNTDDTGTLVNSWDANLTYTGAVETLLKSGSDLYVGSGTLDKVALASGAVDPSWDPRPGGSARFLGLAVQGSSLIAAGSFTHMNTVERQGGAAFDSSGRVTAWDPHFNSNAFAIEVAGSTAYVVGDFSAVNGSVPRDHAAAFNLDDTGMATPWDPAVDSTIYDIEIQGSTAYIAGDFSDVGGQTRNYLAAVSLSGSGQPTNWNPNLDYSSYDIALSNGLAYVVGDFSQVNGSPAPQRYAAAFRLDDTGTVTDWRPDMNSYGYGIDIYGGAAYVVGDFTAVNEWGGSGVPRNHAAAFALDDSGTATAWDPDASGPVYDVEVSGGYAYLLGDFGTINGSVSRAGLAAVDTGGAGLVSDEWVPAARGGFAPGSFYEGGLALAGSSVLAMGEFPVATLNGADYPGSLARLPIIGGAPTPPLTPAPAYPPSAPRDVAVTAGDAQLTVTWEAPAHPGSFPVSHYRVSVNPGGHACVTTQPTCSVTGVANGREYAVTVEALNGAGWGHTSAPVYATPGGDRVITILGTRSGKRISIVGTAAGMDTGAVLKPWTRPAGGAYQEGAAQILVDTEGEFTWQRRSGKRISVYVATPDGELRSNAVTIPAARSFPISP